jgi:hypothetical protein
MKQFLQVTWQENWKICCSLGMEPLSAYSDFGKLNELSKLITKMMMKNFNCNPHPVDSLSIWTGGTRKQCNGQYSWCFSKPITHDMLDSQTLASSSRSGACVLATRNPNSLDKMEYAFINEDCNTKAKNVCFFFGAYTSPAFSYVRI